MKHTLLKGTKATVVDLASRVGQSTGNISSYRERAGVWSWTVDLPATPCIRGIGAGEPLMAFHKVVVNRQFSVGFPPVGLDYWRLRRSLALAGLAFLRTGSVMMRHVSQ